MASVRRVPMRPYGGRVDTPSSLFAYGSLVASADRGRGDVVVLRDHVRDWSVAMDNRRTIPGYKSYTLGGRRPHLHVAFLTVVPQAGGAVNGLALPVSAEALRALDDRERNYDLVEVTGRIRPALRGRVFTYMASAAGRARYERARAAGDGAVHRDYLRTVTGGFAALGAAELARYRRSTRRPPFPVLPLVRHELARGAWTADGRG